jgi:hypothetical protein
VVQQGKNRVQVGSVAVQKGQSTLAAVEQVLGPEGDTAAVAMVHTVRIVVHTHIAEVAVHIVEAAVHTAVAARIAARVSFGISTLIAQPVP